MPASDHGSLRNLRPGRYRAQLQPLRSQARDTQGERRRPSGKSHNPRRGLTEQWFSPKISLDFYRKESLKIVAVFRAHSDVVEKASIDESFLDLSLRVRAVLLERYPALAAIPQGASQEDEVPSPAELGVTIDWESIGNMIPVPGDEGGHHVELGWADVALAAAAELAAKARNQVLQSLGYTCSAGIASNKVSPSTWCNL